MPENLIASLESSSPEVPVTPAPSPTPAPEATPESVNAPEAKPESAPETPVTPETPAPSEPALYDLPDGRKVDAATLSREFKEKFLPDYTRKSQELSRLKNSQPPEAPKTDATPAPAGKPWESPDWQPKDWNEVLQVATEQALERLTSTDREKAEQAQLVEQYVSSQLDEVKALDPKVDEGQLFAHATKYGFTDLKAAHINMKEMQSIRMTTEQNVLKNLKTRAAEPIAGGSGPKVTTDEVDPANTSRFSSAADALRFIKR